MRNALAALIFGLTAAGCSSGGAPAAGLGPTGAPDAAGFLDGCSNQDALHAATISDFVGADTHGWAYTPMSVDGMNSVTTATRALDEGDVTAAGRSAKQAGYRVVPLVTASGCYLLLQPTADAPPGQATLIYAAAWNRNLIVEAPHVPEDHRTDAEAAILFVRLRAKALMIAGAHRCAITTPSGCRATTQCNPSGIAVESDPAHSVFNAINAMHLAFRTTDAVTLQLHSNIRPDLNGDALVSNGTTYPIAGALSDAFFAALSAPDIDVRTCNDRAHAPLRGAYCGDTNTQSLASNGAADQCLGRPSGRGDAGLHRFIHLEQNTQRMDAVDSWAARVGDALAAAIPVSR